MIYFMTSIAIAIEGFILINLATDFSLFRKINDINDFIDEALERRTERRREKRRKKLEKESDELCEREGYERKEVY